MAFAPLSNMPNLVNVTKRLDPDGSIATIAELLEQANPILKDVPMIEGNLPVGHRTTVRSDTPTPTWRMLNYGTRNTKSTTTQVDDTIGMLEDWGEVDSDLASINGNTAQFRMSENIPHIHGMSNEMASTLFYGDVADDPKKFTGIAPRYGVVGLAGKPTAVTGSSMLPNVIDHGDTANLTSIYYIVWGQDTVHGIYPKGSTAGLQAKDLGEKVLYDNDGKKFMGYQDHYQWKMGISVRDWRYVSRLANIDVQAVLTSDAELKALYQNMIKMMHAIPQNGRQRGVFYCGAVIAAALDLAATEKSNLSLGYTQVFGEEIMSFRKRPIRECNAILETETRVV